MQSSEYLLKNVVDYNGMYPDDLEQWRRMRDSVEILYVDTNPSTKFTNNDLIGMTFYLKYYDEMPIGNIDGLIIGSIKTLQGEKINLPIHTLYKTKMTDLLDLDNLYQMNYIGKNKNDIVIVERYVVLKQHDVICVLFNNDFDDV